MYFLCGHVVACFCDYLVAVIKNSLSTNVEATREVVLQCLMEYLGERREHLIKEFNVGKLNVIYVICHT